MPFTKETASAYGAKGGKKAGKPKGFAANRELARTAGALGGSKAGKKKRKESL